MKDRQFQPYEFVQMVDDLFSALTNPVIGFLIGVLYSIFTMVVAFGIWINLSMILISSDLQLQAGVSLSGFSITIGTFVLVAAANLIDHYEKELLNFRAYIRDAILFVSGGICFFTGFVAKLGSIRFVDSALLSFPIEIFSAAILFIGAGFITLATWTLLKLLWRLQQLIKWNADYEPDKPAYSELRASAQGFVIGAKMRSETSKKASWPTWLLMRIFSFLLWGGLGYFIFGQGLIFYGVIAYLILSTAISIVSRVRSK